MNKRLKYYLSFLLFISSVCLYSKGNPEEKALIAKTQIIKYKQSEKGLSQLLLEMPFAKNSFMDLSELKGFRHNGVIKVELVFTKYKEVDEFSQLQLNKKRYNNLYSQLPELFNDLLIEWVNVEQTFGETKEEARKLFHGFVITYRPFNDSVGTNDELQYLVNMFEDDVDLEEFKKDLPEEKDSVKRHSPSEQWDKIVGYGKERKKPKKKPKTNIEDMPRDSTVAKTLEKASWEDMLVVVDVTGSMSPYQVQVFQWYRQHFNSGKVKHFTFFNDGDKKKKGSKKIGKTGGIYHSPALSFDQVIKTSMRAMKGSASHNMEVPENDFEALIMGINECKDCKSVVLIADNNSLARDYVLINNIKRPVHIIACGVYGRINVQYMDLARKTGGSIHTPHGDIDGLEKIRNGDSIRIGRYTYFLNEGQFVSN